MKNKISFRPRDIAGEACVMCGVPAGTACRSTETWEPFERASHRVPEPVEQDPESASAEEDERRYLESQELEEVSK